MARCFHGRGAARCIGHSQLEPVGPSRGQRRLRLSRPAGNGETKYQDDEFAIVVPGRQGYPDRIALKSRTFSGHTRRAHIASQAISNGLANRAKVFTRTRLKRYPAA